MFETDSSAEFFGLSNDPNRKAQGLDLGGKSAYGFNASLEDFSGSASGQQLGSSLMDDPWLGDLMSSDDLGGGQSTQQDLTGRDLVTGIDDGANGSGEDGGGTFTEGTTTRSEIREVFNLLSSRSRYDREEITADRHYTNRCFGHKATSSADEWWGFDRGDARSNAIDIGQIVYRSGAQVDGFAGFTTKGVRDKNDWYKFSVGKAGEIDISLTGLTQNAGVALYGSKGNLISWSDKSGSQSESVLESLGKGDYYARVYSYNQQPWGHGQTGYTLNVSRKADALEKYWENLLTDASIENAALNSIKYENHLSRNDVIGILKSADDQDLPGNINLDEINDLQKFYNKAINTTHVRDDVKVLSKKVIFGDTSNQWYTGSDSVRDTLGNIQVGWSATNLNLLIGKHFLGTDRPAIGMANSTYERAGGSLFQGGVSATDIDQGSTGTCYLLSSLAGTANDKPGMINSMFKANGDDTWSVRYYVNGKADYVTVDRMMPTNANGRYIHNDHGGAGKQMVAGNNELWGALAEKAYAQMNESGNLGQATATNYYGIGNQANTGISWGSRSSAMRHITGLNVTSQNVGGYTNASLSGIVNSDNVVTYGVNGHARSIVGYDSTNGDYQIQDPYGQTLYRTYAEIVAWGGNISYTNT